MSENKMSISSIKNNKKCMSCGACSSICMKSAVSLQYNKNTGFYEPKVKKEYCIECGLCMKICPAMNQEDASLTGDYNKIYLAHSTNYEVRKNATSGGVANSLVRYLIDSEMVECVLMTSLDSNSPTESGSLIVTKENVDLLLLYPRDFASRYVSVPLLTSISNIIQNYNKIAVVGTPCQIRALSRFPSELLKNIDIFKIGITCSGGISYKATIEYKRKMNMSQSKIFYRGNGWPGKNTLIECEKKAEFDHLGSFFERMFSSQIFKNPGCRYCKDHFAEEADISFCDFWNTREIKEETIGNSCVIVRSRKAEQIIDSMKAGEYICVVRELAEEDLVNSQINVLNAKKGSLRLSSKYKAFCRVCDFIFKYNLYRFFGLKIYQKFCNYYISLCRDFAIKEIN